MFAFDPNRSDVTDVSWGPWWQQMTPWPSIFRCKDNTGAGTEGGMYKLAENPGHCDNNSQSLPRFYIIWTGNQIPEISQTRAHLWEHLGNFWTAWGDKILRVLGRTWTWGLSFVLLYLENRILSLSQHPVKREDCSWVVGVNDRDRGDEIASLEH